MNRSTREVLEDHLERRRAGDLEGDLAHNYAEDDLIVLSKDGAYRGQDGIRTTASFLKELLPGARYSYDIVRAEGEIALLVWSCTADNGATVCEGADSFVIRDGRIVTQTICYAVKEAD